jgi:hypothetical protein
LGTGTETRVASTSGAGRERKREKQVKKGGQNLCWIFTHLEFFLRRLRGLQRLLQCSTLTPANFLMYIRWKQAKRTLAMHEWLLLELSLGDATRANSKLLTFVCHPTYTSTFHIKACFFLNFAADAKSFV